MWRFVIYLFFLWPAALLAQDSLSNTYFKAKLLCLGSTAYASYAGCIAALDSADMQCLRGPKFLSVLLFRIQLQDDAAPYYVAYDKKRDLFLKVAGFKKNQGIAFFKVLERDQPILLEIKALETYFGLTQKDFSAKDWRYLRRIGFSEKERTFVELDLE